MATGISPTTPHGAWDATPPDEALYEIVDGSFEEKPMGAYEVDLACVLFELLAPFVRAHRLGRIRTEMVFDLRPAVDRGRRPDLAFVSAERWPLARPVPRANAWHVVPDLAVEIISPTNTAASMAQKIQEYFVAGVRRVWVIYPDSGLVYIHETPGSIRVLSRSDALIDEALFPGFRLDLAEFFGPTDGPAPDR